MDLFVHWGGSDPNELAGKIQKMESKGIYLSMITNRGIKVWPDGFRETFCTDHWRCRFKAKNGEQMYKTDIIELLEKAIEEDIDAIKTENLYAFDGTACLLIRSRPINKINLILKKNNMENNKVTLIDGTFNVAEAKDVLTNMFTMKINFHSQKNVSHVERFGKTDDAALEKVEFLKAELAKLETIIAAATNKNVTLKVTSNIHIDYINEPA